MFKDIYALPDDELTKMTCNKVELKLVSPRELSDQGLFFYI